MENQVTITEALKTLKVIKKRMQSNTTHITKYSSQPENEKPLLGNETEQKKEINSLIQANTDLAKEYQRLHKAITLTNMVVKVNISGQTYSIHDLLVFKRDMFSLLQATYNAMNDNTFQQAIRGLQDKSIHIQRFYDEKKKREELRVIEDMFNEIDSRLETINATTPIVKVEEILK